MLHSITEKPSGARDPQPTDSVQERSLKFRESVRGSISVHHFLALGLIKLQAGTIPMREDQRVYLSQIGTIGIDVDGILATDSITDSMDVG